MSRNPLQTKLIQIIEPVVQAAKLELVDVRFLLEQGGWTLRVQIDVPVAQITNVNEVPTERVSLLECENMSRELSAVLDVEDPIKQAYALEVSSPGIDRSLRTPAHFRHFAGSEAKIALAFPLQTEAGERRNFKGVLRGATDTHVTIECDGQPFELVIDDIDHAKLVPDWDAVMRGKSGVGAPTPKPIKPGHRPSQKHKH
ncbi:MAG TPA: ribosome maturation factor RimP [Kofleriaceae bacterium]|nr:ribosome maturation factor RimP [Kofleriaceae bacterium]